MLDFKTVVSKILRGYRKSAIVNITNRCNAKCSMCGIWAERPKKDMVLEDAKKVIDFLTEWKCLAFYVTGGEPSLNPHLVDIIRYAKSRGMVTSFTTNGTITERMLVEGNPDVLSVSVDHFDPEICDDVKGIRGISEKVEKTIKLSKELGIPTYTLTYLGPWITEDDETVEKMVRYVNEYLGVPFALCYPLNTKENTYKLGGKLSDYPTQSSSDILRTVKKIKALKSEIKCKIATPKTYLDEIIRWHKERSPIFPCKGGEAVVYIDQYLDVYPCFSKKKLFNISDGASRFQKNVKCRDCLANCFWEPSIEYQTFSHLFPIVVYKEAKPQSFFIDLFRKN